MCVPKYREPLPAAGVTAVSVVVASPASGDLEATKETLIAASAGPYGMLAYSGLNHTDACIIYPVQEHPEGFAAVGLTVLLRTTPPTASEPQYPNCSIVAPAAKGIWEESQMMEPAQQWVTNTVRMNFGISILPPVSPALNEIYLERAMQDFLNTLRIDGSGTVDSIAKESADFTSAVEDTLQNTFTKATDSDWCVQRVEEMKCTSHLTKTYSMEVDETCDECQSRLQAFLDSDPQMLVKVAEECSTETTSSLVYFSSVMCTRHRGVLCMRPVASIFYPYFNQSGGVIGPDSTAALAEHCGPCTVKISEGLRAHDAVIGFLQGKQSYTTAIHSNFSRFLEYVCGSADRITGPAGVLPSGDTFCDDTDIQDTNDDVCGQEKQKQCAFRHAVANADTPTEVDRITFACTQSNVVVPNEPNALCGAVYDSRSPVVDVLVSEASCNLGVLAYLPNVQKCSDAIATAYPNETVSVCDALQKMGCCAGELLHAYLRRNLFTQPEMEAGMQLLCPLLTVPQRCFFAPQGTPSAPSTKSWQLVLKVSSPQYIRLNNVQLLEALRSDLSLSLHVPASLLGDGELSIVGPDTVVAAFPSLDSTIDATSLNLALRNSKAFYQSSMYGDITLLSSSSGVRSGGAESCGALMTTLHNVCGEAVLEGLLVGAGAAADGWPGAGFCSSACFAAVVAGVDAIVQSCPGTIAAPVVFVAEMACVELDGKNCFTTVLSEKGVVSTAVTTLRTEAAVSATLKDSICAEPCTARMLTAQQRYNARLMNLGIQLSSDDDLAAYKLALLQASCTTLGNSTATDDVCFSDSFTQLNAMRSLGRISDTSSCPKGGDDSRSACVSRTLRLASEYLLRNPSAPFNASGVFKSRCVKNGATYCGALYDTVGLELGCEPVKLNGTVPAGCVAEIKKRVEVLGCCEARLLAGMVESMQAVDRHAAIAAHSATLAAVGIDVASLPQCPSDANATQAVTLHITADYAWCASDPEACKHALTADLLQNMGLHSAEAQNVTVASADGTIIVTASVATGTSSYDTAVADTLLSNRDAISLSNTNQWAREHTAEPVMVVSAAASVIGSSVGPVPSGPEVIVPNPSGDGPTPTDGAAAPSDAGDAMSGVFMYVLPACGLCVMASVLVMALRRRSKATATGPGAMAVMSDPMKCEHVDMTEIASAVSDSSTPYCRDVSTSFVDPSSVKDREMSI